jgi:hypothetical protein
MRVSSRILAVIFLSVTATHCGDSPGLFDTDGPRDAVTLAWDAPTANVDGSPLTDLAGYRIYFGQTSPLTVANSTSIYVGNVTSYTISTLEPGTYYFAVSALDVVGNASELSEVVSAEIP